MPGLFRHVPAFPRGVILWASLASLSAALGLYAVGAFRKASPVRNVDTVQTVKIDRPPGETSSGPPGSRPRSRPATTPGRSRSGTLPEARPDEDPGPGPTTKPQPPFPVTADGVEISPETGTATLVASSTAESHSEPVELPGEFVDDVEIAQESDRATGELSKQFTDPDIEISETGTVTLKRRQEAEDFRPTPPEPPGIFVGDVEIAEEGEGASLREHQPEAPGDGVPPASTTIRSRGKTPERPN